MPIRYFLSFFLLFPVLLSAQITYDDCSGAFLLEDLDSWCSEVGTFTNLEATPSSDILPTCFDANANIDVWLSFVAIAPNVSVSVVGNVPVNSGGSLLSPNLALYSGSCDELNILECQTSSFEINQVSIFSEALMVGNVYYIRIGTTVGDAGTFELCVNNFAEVPNPDGDCAPGVILCDKSSFSTGFVPGAGANPNEIGDVGCNSGTCDLSESSSTWYKWVCDEAGSLAFTISPLNPSDDIDFVLFELPNGIDDCSGKFDIRCMASGENVGNPIEDWVACTGPTGLSIGDPDLSESCGCESGNNNFAEAVMMESGKAYALVINNFTQSESGFSIDFGGTGTFLGPDIGFTYSPLEDICIGETVTYEDTSSFVGNIIAWNWDFGQGADPQTATGPGPHIVTYNNSGNKTALLQIETERGCFSSLFENSVTVTCCNNELEIMGEVKGITCDSDSLGSIKLKVLPLGSSYDYQWSNGATGSEITDLDAGEYTVTVSDGVQCEKVATFQVENIESYMIDTIVTPETGCFGGNGRIELVVTGGVAPYLFDWDNGDGWVDQNEQTGLSEGRYQIKVKDGANCLGQIEVEIKKELGTDTNYEIPNVFTPNGDSKNDEFRVFGNEALTQGVEFFQMNIFNRWGELVFESNEITKAWDGEYKGKPAPSDVYLYRVELLFPCDEEHSIEAGEITLLR